MTESENGTTVLRIAILEDEPDDAALIERELGKAGFAFEVRRCDDGPSFEEVLRSFEPQVVLADYGLPDYSGLEALDFVQSHFPETVFIYVTGAIGEEFAAETILNGASGYVLKSNLKRLPSVVENALGRSRTWFPWRAVTAKNRVLNQIESNIDVLQQINAFLQRGHLPDKKVSQKVEEAISLLQDISRSSLEKELEAQE